MSEPEHRLELPPPGGVAWLDISAATADSRYGRVRTGPLGLQIGALPGARGPFFFKGARLRGARCSWSASTLSGAELARQPRPVGSSADGAIHLLARADSPGSVFDPVPRVGPGSQTNRGLLRVVDPMHEIHEQFPGNSHLFTLNVQRGTLGVEPATLADMLGQSYELTPFQARLMRSAVGLLLTSTEEFHSSASLVGIDRYLGALAGLVLRSAVRPAGNDVELMDSIRSRTDTIIFEQAVDPLLSPATIAAQLRVSLRQLYRAFNGTESPAARIRRRRLEHAAELLAARTAPAQVDKIAQDCGFVSAEYFSRAFRREFGLSPRAYRSTHRVTSAPGKN